MSRHRSSLAHDRDWSWVRSRVEQSMPDVVILLLGQHRAHSHAVTPRTFSIGCGESFGLNWDDHTLAQSIPVAVHLELAHHIAETCAGDEFDIATTTKLLDFERPRLPPLLIAKQRISPDIKFVPIAVDLARYPPPSGNHCWQIGQAIGRAIASFPANLNVQIWSVNNCTVQTSSRRVIASRNSFDANFLLDLAQNAQRLRQLRHIDYFRNAGPEGIDCINWLILRGALGEEVAVVESDATGSASECIVLHPKSADLAAASPFLIALAT